jgi:predicted transcriptional regulator of viral defense system
MANADAQAPVGLPEYVDGLQATGRYTFSTEDARTALPLSEIALDSALRRLRQRGRVVSPRRGFHVIVQQEYALAGSPPPPWFIDELMAYLGQPYYVGLLSAAALHGASHQQPMVFQVLTDRPTREAAAGRSRIEFHMSGSLVDTPAVRMQTETGSMLVSTPEATAFDLVRHPEACGGWSAVATVLGELAERLDPSALALLARARKTPEIQRLGYLLDRVGEARRADPLLRVLGSRRYRRVRLASDEAVAEDPAAYRPEGPWRVIPNVDVEVDE